MAVPTTAACTPVAMASANSSPTQIPPSAITGFPDFSTKVLIISRLGSFVPLVCGVYPLIVVPIKSNPISAAWSPSSMQEQSAINNCSGYFARTFAKKSSKLSPFGRLQIVASIAIISVPQATNASTSFMVGVIYTSQSSYTCLIMPITGRSTVFLISIMSSTLLERMPLAPPSIAAYAILPIM